MSERKVMIKEQGTAQDQFRWRWYGRSPYCDERGGAVLNSTIDKYAYCTISPRKDNEITIRSLDLGRVERWKAGEGIFAYDGNLDLIKAALNHFDVDQGFDMFVHCDAPPGSGLGSSSTVIVSIIGALSEWLNAPLSQYEIASLAYVLERNELKLAGGKQDQYVSVFGGFNYMEFRSDDAIVMPLRLKSDVLNELHYVAPPGEHRKYPKIKRHHTEPDHGICKRGEGGRRGIGQYEKIGQGHEGRPSQRGHLPDGRTS